MHSYITFAVFALLASVATGQAEAGSSNPQVESHGNFILRPQGSTGYTIVLQASPSATSIECSVKASQNELGCGIFTTTSFDGCPDAVFTTEAAWTPGTSMEGVFQFTDSASATLLSGQSISARGLIEASAATAVPFHTKGSAADNAAASHQLNGGGSEQQVHDRKTLAEDDEFSQEALTAAVEVPSVSPCKACGDGAEDQQQSTHFTGQDGVATSSSSTRSVAFRSRKLHGMTTTLQSNQDWHPCPRWQGGPCPQAQSGTGSGAGRRMKL